MKKEKVVEVPQPVVCTSCPVHQARNRELESSLAEYKKAYDTLKMKLQTIFNITQL